MRLVLLVINTNLPPLMHRFQVMADYWSNFRYYSGQHCEQCGRAVKMQGN